MNPGKPSSDRVAQALDIHRSIEACHDHLARSSGVHTLTAALMLPCYRAEFGKLALQLTPAEARELRTLLAPASIDGSRQRVVPTTA